MSWLGDKFDTLSDQASSAFDSVKDVVVSYARLNVLAAQGLVMGVAGSIASIGDMAYNSAAWAVNSESRIDMAGSATTAIREHGLEPEGALERAAMTAGQVVGEVAGFAAVIVVTGGVGGVVVGGVAGAARVTMTAARMVNPIASATAATIETAGMAYSAYHIYTTDQGLADIADQIEVAQVESILDKVIEKATIINDTMKNIEVETLALTDQLTGKDLSLPENEHLIVRAQQLIDAGTIAKALFEGEIPEENMEQAYSYLDQAGVLAKVQEDDLEVKPTETNKEKTASFEETRGTDLSDNPEKFNGSAYGEAANEKEFNVDNQPERKVSGFENHV